MVDNAVECDAHKQAYSTVNNCLYSIRRRIAINFR